MKIEILIFVISILLMPYFLFDIFSNFSNQAGITSLISPIFNVAIVNFLRKPYCPSLEKKEETAK